MPTGRNDPCPCGSGLKYKRCCHDPALDATAQPWHIQLKKTTRNANLLIVLKNIERWSLDCDVAPNNLKGAIISSWYLAFLAIHYIVNEDPSNAREIGEAQFLEAINLILKIPYSETEFEKEVINSEFKYFIRTFYLQDSYNEPMFKLWGRGLIFYKYYKEYDSRHNFDILALFKEVYGLDPDTFFFLGMAFYATAATNADFNVANVLGTTEPKFQPYISKEKVDKFLAALSATPQTLRETYLENLEKKTIEFKLNPLKSRPIVSLGSGVYSIPVIRLLIEKVFSGVFYDLNDFLQHDNQAKNRFRIYFGELFERYVGELIDHHLGDGYEIYHSFEAEGLEIDHLIVEKDKALFVIETTLGSTTLRLRESAGVEEVRHYSERLAEEIEKLYRREQAATKLKGQVTAYPVLLIFEPLPLANSIFRGHIDHILDNKYGIKEYRYHLINISEFEDLCDLVLKKKPLLSEVFSRKEKTETFDLREYIYGFMRSNISGEQGTDRQRKIRKKYASCLQADWKDFLYYEINAEESKLFCDYLRDVTERFWQELGLSVPGGAES